MTRTIEDAIADAKADPEVDWFTVSFSWSRTDDRLGGWSADVSGTVDGKEWGSGETNGSDGAEVLDRARTEEEAE